MTALPYEYACALKDAGYPQPKIAPGQTWYSIETAQVYDVLAHGKKSGKFLRRPQKSGLAYAPGFEELAKAANVKLPAMLTIEELADLWLAQNKNK
jgi:hypothetical protein